MPKIFISYRREDSQYQADRLHQALRKHVANPKRDIFIDVDNIPVGVDFVEHLDHQVAQCDVLLAVIGPTWLNSGGGIAGRPAARRSKGLRPRRDCFGVEARHPRCTDPARWRCYAVRGSAAS